MWHDGNFSIVSPYTLIWNVVYYYMVGWNHEQEEIRTYHVERILKAPDILKNDAESASKSFDVEHYTRKVFRMVDCF